MLLNVKKYLALAAVVGMTAVFGAGCSSAAKATPSAQAKVAVSTAALVIADVTSIKLTVSDNAVAPLFTAIETVLSKAPAGNVWTGNVSQIPANPAPGSARRFKAEAFNGTTKVYEGDSVAAVYAGQTADVVIILQEAAPAPGTTNYAPVITALTSTSAYVAPGTSGSSTVVANDPDNNSGPLAYAWSAACDAGGTMGFGTPNAATTTWTAPSVNSLCTVTIRVTETGIAQPLSVTTYFTISVNVNYANANIAAFPNSFPIVTARGDFRYNFFSDVLTIPVGQQGDLFFTALDPDGDNVRFDLSLRCKDDTAVPPVPFSAQPSTFFSASTFTTTSGGPVAPPAQSSFTFNPTFGYPQPAVAAVTNPRLDCEFKIQVQDLCTGGNCGAAGAQGFLPDGADKVTTVNNVVVKSFTTGLINTTHPAQAKRAPIVVRTIAPNQLGPVATGVQTWDPAKVALVQPSTQYLLQAEADDRYEGGTLLPTYACANGTFVAGSVHTGNLRDSLLWTSPAALTIGMQCTITFTSSGATGSGLSTVATFKFAGSDPCVGAVDGTACNDGNACTTGETCQAGVCTVPAAGTTTCTAADSCHVAGVCNPLTGVCSIANAPNGTSCSDGNACTTGEVCTAGSCGSGNATVCLASGTCFDAGVCNPATGACSNPPSAAGTACNDGNLCATGDTCNGSGTCLAGPNVVNCASSDCSTGGTCNPATGACQGGANQPDGTACTTDNNACTADVCAGGACVHNSTCTAGQVCNTTTGCASTRPVPTRALDLRLSPPGGATINSTGNAYVVGTLGVITPVNFQTRAGGLPAINLQSLGGADAFVAKYDTAGDITWAVTVQDDSAAAITDQTATLVAVNSADRVGVIGKFAGTVSFPVGSAGGANPTPYIAAFNGATGARAWVNGYDLGSNGLFQSVAANPTQASNRFAACGFADGAATGLVTGAVYGGAQDAVIGAWDNAGVKLWSKQIGTAFNETCASVTIDDNGDVVATGQFDGASIDLGNGFVLTGPNSSTRKFIWVARFAGATGVTQQAIAYSGTLGNAVPRSLAVAPNGDIALGGSFTGNLTIGAAMTTAGSEDGFVALLDGVTFAPVWNAVRFGGTGLDLIRSVAVTSFGDIVVQGNFLASSAAFRTANGGNDTNGFAGLVSLGTADIIVAKLNGATGATDAATGYGNATTQSGDVIAVNRFGATPNQIVFTNSSAGSVNFGGQTFTATGTNDVALVFATLQ